jgi:hypothetical protein
MASSIKQIYEMACSTSSAAEEPLLEDFHRQPQILAALRRIGANLSLNWIAHRRARQ